jgi:maltooligosyltrehalose trehalohydrolase
MDRSAINFMEQLSIETRALEAETGRQYVLIAESDLNDPRLVSPRNENGYGLDAQWSDDFHHALVAVLTPDRGGYYADFGTLADLAKALKQVFVYNGRYSAYRDLIHGRPVANLPAWRFLGYAQDHDQVGNRAKGERLSQLTSTGRAKIAATIVLTAPFVPMLFQGEEWAASTPFLYFTDHEDKELGRLVSEGRRKEFAAFGWHAEDIPDPQDPTTFESSKLQWNELNEPAHAEMLDWYRTLIAFRRETPELINGSLADVEIRYDEDQKWLTMQRGPVLVAANVGPAAVTLSAEPGVKPILLSHTNIAVEQNSITLPPDSVAILKTR